MSRKSAYFGVLKFYFAEELTTGMGRRAAWKAAKALAASYVFGAKSESLKIWVPVW